MVEAERSAEAIVNSACRGEGCLTVLRWLRVTHMLKFMLTRGGRVDSSVAVFN